jgi:hypothetical protein
MKCRHPLRPPTGGSSSSGFLLGSSLEDFRRFEFGFFKFSFESLQFVTMI